MEKIARVRQAEAGRSDRAEGGTGVAKWRLSATARNHKGCLRADNEDNFYLEGKWMSLSAMAHGGRFTNQSEALFQLYAVCDGMGGGDCGGQASLRAVQALHALRVEYEGGMEDQTVLAFLATLTDEIHAMARTEQDIAGTTLTAILWQEGRLRVLNIGDSRVYRLRQGKLARLTVDHSEVQRMVDLGLMTPFQARFSPRRHYINQYLGLPSQEDAFQPYLSAMLPARPGDVYLLCSDGLTGMLEDAEIRRILLRARDASEAVDLLVQQALDYGGHDTVTALCVEVAESAHWGAGLKRQWYRFQSGRL